MAAAIVLVIGSAVATAAGAQPLTGQVQTITVARGDTLGSLGRVSESIRPLSPVTTAERRACLCTLAKC
jgi:hypothetical protein